MMRAFTTALVFPFLVSASAWLFSQEDPPREASDDKEAPADGEKEKKEAPAAKEPEFKKASSKTDFEKAKSQYEMEKFKEAEAIFKRVKADAKTKEDKDLVEVWVQAAGGAQLLARIKLQVSQSKVQQAYEEAQAFLRKYKGTPVEAGFQKLLEELASQLFVPLENFDAKSAEYTEKYGKFFIDDPKLSLDGTQCLRWTNTADRKLGQLKLKRVPVDWREFEAIELWVNMTQPPPSLEAMIMMGEQAAPTKGRRPATKKKKADSGEASSDFYLASIPLSAQKGWQRVRLKIGEFKPNGQATGTLASVLDFRIQIDGGNQFDFLIDKIALMKKDQPVGASPKPTGPKGKK